MSSRRLQTQLVIGVRGGNSAPTDFQITLSWWVPKLVYPARPSRGVDVPQNFLGNIIIDILLNILQLIIGSRLHTINILRSHVNTHTPRNTPQERLLDYECTYRQVPINYRYGTHSLSILFLPRNNSHSPYVRLFPILGEHS